MFALLLVVVLVVVVVAVVVVIVVGIVIVVNVSAYTYYVLRKHSSVKQSSKVCRVALPVCLRHNLYAHLVS